MPKKGAAARTGAGNRTPSTRKSPARSGRSGKSAVAGKPGKPAGPRRIRPGQYSSFKLQKRIRHPVRLPSVWRITGNTARNLWRHKWLFAGVTLIYGFVNFGLAQGFSGGTDVASLKEALNGFFTGDFGFVLSGLSIFALMVSSAGNTSDPTAGAYQMILLIMASLAVIWALRQALTGKNTDIRIRDAYYRGMSPLVPFMLVMLVIGIQLIPFILGSTLYSLVINNGIAIYAVEKIIWGVVWGMLTILSLYMLCSSVFALYIVTLPEMTPVKALRSARALVRYRRWTVLRKILFMPVLLLVVAMAVMLPVIWLAAPLARWVFFLLTMFAMLGVHAYMYTLYRELLRE